MSKSLSLNLTVILGLILLGCSNKTEQAQQPSSSLYKIDLSGDVIYESESPKFSTFFKGIEYIKLETSENSLVQGNPMIYTSAEYIYTVAFRQILQFDRKDGHFIKEIGHYGFDPEGYIATLPTVQPFNMDEHYVSTGKYIKRINSIDNRLEIMAKNPQGLQGFALLDSGTFVSYIPNFDCNEKYRLLIYSNDESEIKKFKNHLACEKHDKGSFSIDMSEGQFYYLNSEVLFKESYNDTIFRVTRDQLIPHAYFNLGEFAIKYQDKENLKAKDRRDKIWIERTFESDEYIFFNYWFKEKTYHSIYSKLSNTCFIPDKLWIENGIIDDLHNFIDFRPLSINPNNEVVGVLNPDEILHWFNSSKPVLNSLPKSINQLRDVKSEDNPIIAIATLK